MDNKFIKASFNASSLFYKNCEKPTYKINKDEATKTISSNGNLINYHP